MTSQINLAFLRIAKRAERQNDATLARTFVDFGAVLAALSSVDHNLIFGRRGTGKTHLLTVLRTAREREGTVAVQLDMRNLGSTGGIYADPQIPISQRATRLLIDVLAAIHGHLLEQALADDSKVDLGAAGTALDELFDSHRDVKVVGTTTVETATTAENSYNAESKIGVTATPTSASLTAEGKATDGGKEAVTAKKTVVGHEIHRVNFGSVSNALRKVVGTFPGAKLWLLIDEWSEVPLDLQPMLADLLRRAVLPIRGVTVKIAAIEQRSRFMIPDTAVGNVGIEVGADVSAAVNLDDFMVFDNDGDKAVEFFRALIYAHARAEMEEAGAVAPADQVALISAAFTQANAFEEVVRACEGVPRDAINILSAAAQRANDSSISVGDVRTAAQNWYLGTKDAAVSAHHEAKRLLTWLIEKIIKERRTKGFLLEAGLRDPLIDFLYDERVLHVLRKGMSAKDQPGKRFIVYGIDYGCYVDLISTVRAPQGVLDLGDAAGSNYSHSVPHTDLRSIRRCILDLPDFYGATVSAPTARADTAAG
ncbi:hypothetical protein [Rhodoferax sp.]|uniref:hypothetical protein n=1 Tax=Rhodoferax sp. TaxID=50421 RepID=UPI002778B17D|nr:hypothetical protein [Rhodoferax sp.]